MIPNLTEFILSCRVRLGYQEAHTPLPPEIVNDIIQLVPFLGSEPQEGAQRGPQIYWRLIFVDGRLLPFLWDLKLCQALQSEGDDISWNYELLVRQLAQVEYFESGKNVPPGLRNRRRIWRLVEEMYVGDVRSDQSLGLMPNVVESESTKT